MNRTIKAFALPLLAAAIACTPILAQDHQDQEHHDQAQSQDHHDNGNYRQHNDWQRGSRIQQQDWNRGDKVDYRANHLRRPSHGREWRQIDGNYILAGPDGRIDRVQRARHDDHHDENGH